MNKKYLIELIKSVILSKQPLEKPDEVSFEEIFKISKIHNIANLVYYAVAKLENKPDEKLLKLWKQEYSISIMRDIVQKEEFSILKNVFNENAIKHILLKGFELKRLYPKSDMRDMSDLDILIQNKDREKVKKLLEKLNYTTEKYGKGKDDIYYKKPIMNIEIHNSLLPESLIEKYPYLLKLNKMEKSIKIKDYTYTFSKDDILIYGIVHIAKHFEIAGTGIKSVIDWYLYSKKNFENIDWNYVNSSLEELNLNKFYQTLIDLGKVWFEEKSHTDLTKNFEEHIFNSGAYGNINDKILNNLAKNNNNISLVDRIRTLKKMTFPTYLVMCEQYPILKTRKKLLYLYYIKRIFEIIFFRRKNKLKIIKTIFSEDKSTISKRKQFYKDIGLEK